MPTLTVVTATRTGLEASYDACDAGGDEFLNTGVELISIKNGSGADIVMTIVSQATVDTLAVADRTVTITLGEERIIGPWPTATYNDGAGKVQLTYDGVTSLTIAVFNPGS